MTLPAIPPRQHDFRLADIRDSWLCKRCGAPPSVLPKGWECPGAPPPGAPPPPPAPLVLPDLPHADEGLEDEEVDWSEVEVAGWEPYEEDPER